MIRGVIPPEFLCAFKKLWLDENGTEFIEVKSRPHKNIALAKIKGVDTIEAAEKIQRQGCVYQP